MVPSIPRRTMSTHEDAKDPKDLKGSESMKPDPEFQDFFPPPPPTTGIRVGGRSSTIQLRFSSFSFLFLSFLSFLSLFLFLLIFFICRQSLRVFTAQRLTNQWQAGQFDEGSTPPRDRGASTFERKASCVWLDPASKLRDTSLSNLTLSRVTSYTHSVKTVRESFLLQVASLGLG